MRYDELITRGLERISRGGLRQYLDLGAESRSQNRLNREYLDSLVFEMRILGSRSAETTTSIFGQTLSGPVVSSPLCASRVMNSIYEEPDYLLDIAGGLADSGSLMMTGNLKLDLLGRIVAQGAPVAHVVHPYKDEDFVVEHLETAERLGCCAVGINVDGMFGCKAWDEMPGPDYLGPQTMRQLERYVNVTRLPFVIKGILSEQDAISAREIGASAIIVSLYGGEAIDYSVPVLEVLPRIRAAVPDLTILVDSGFRRGTDVLKAITLGADAVSLVTLLMIAVAADGRHGVRAMVEILNEEVQRTMSYVGFPTVADTDLSSLRRMIGATAPLEPTQRFGDVPMAGAANGLGRNRASRYATAL